MCDLSVCEEVCSDLHSPVSSKRDSPPWVPSEKLPRNPLASIDYSKSQCVALNCRFHRYVPCVSKGLLRAPGVLVKSSLNIYCLDVVPQKCQSGCGASVHVVTLHVKPSYSLTSIYGTFTT